MWTPRSSVISFGTTSLQFVPLWPSNFEKKIRSIHFSNISTNFGQNSAVHVSKCFCFWGTSFPRPLTEALPLDSTGGLSSLDPLRSTFSKKCIKSSTVFTVTDKCTEKVGEIWTCGFRNMRANWHKNRQTNKQTHRHADRNNPFNRKNNK